MSIRDSALFFAWMHALVLWRGLQSPVNSNRTDRIFNKFLLDHVTMRGSRYCWLLMRKGN